MSSTSRAVAPSSRATARHLVVWGRTWLACTVAGRPKSTGHTVTAGCSCLLTVTRKSNPSLPEFSNLISGGGDAESALTVAAEARHGLGISVARDGQQHRRRRNERTGCCRQCGSGHGALDAAAVERDKGSVRSRILQPDLAAEGDRGIDFGVGLEERVERCDEAPDPITVEREARRHAHQAIGARAAS
jgi:hypothetical protein